MFKAIVFMQIRSDDVEYGLRSCSLIDFFCPPQIGTHVAVEDKIGNCIVNDLKQSVISRQKQGCTLDISCLKNCDEPLIYSLVDSGKWSFVVGNTWVFDGDNVNDARTAAMRGKLKELKNVRNGNHQC